MAISLHSTSIALVLVAAWTASAARQASKRNVKPAQQAKDAKATIATGETVNNRDLWMATYGGGAWRYDGETLTHYPVKDGTKDTTIARRSASHGLEAA